MSHDGYLLVLGAGHELDSVPFYRAWRVNDGHAPIFLEIPVGSRDWPDEEVRISAGADDSFLVDIRHPERSPFTVHAHVGVDGTVRSVTMRSPPVPTPRFERWINVCEFYGEWFALPNRRSASGGLDTQLVDWIDDGDSLLVVENVLRTGAARARTFLVDVDLVHAWEQSPRLVISASDREGLPGYIDRGGGRTVVTWAEEGVNGTRSVLAAELLCD